MRQLIVFFSALCICFACNNSTNKKSEENQETQDTITTIQFDSKSYSFGEVIRGEIVEHTFFFTNTGSADLIIEDVQASCGCTTPEWTKEAIKSGEKGKIQVAFNSKGQSFGNKTKQVIVYTNTKPSRSILQFTAMVVDENQYLK